MTQRILVVDDEPAVTDLPAYNLRKAHCDLPAIAIGCLNPGECAL
jgi:hypothetical protein